MTTRTAPARVGIITARTATVSGDTVEVYTHHVDPRCGRTDDRVVEVGVTAADAQHAAWECDYCHAEADHVDRYPGENDLDRPSHGTGSGRGTAHTNGPSEAQMAFLRRLVSEKLDPAIVGDVDEYLAAMHLTGGRGGSASSTIDRLVALPRFSAPGTPAPAANVRTNRYAGRCVKCGGNVPAETGLLTGRPGAWTTEHRDGECVTVEETTTTSGGEPVEGIHRLSGDRVVKVQRGRESGNLYTKLLVVTDTGEVDESGAPIYSGDFLYAPGLISECSAATAMDLDEARAYGALYGICCVCGARLSDEDSIALGIGPVCGGRVYEWSTGRVLTVAQVRMLARLVDGPVPVGRSARTANALVGHGLARLVDVDGVASVEAVA